MIVTEEVAADTVPFQEAFLLGTGDIRGEVTLAAFHQGIQGGAILGVCPPCLGRAQAGASHAASRRGEGPGA